MPPEYEPVHHDPRYDEPWPVRPPEEGYPDDSPWRRTQRRSRPEPGQWHPGQPAQASHDQGEFQPQDRYGEPGQYADQGRYLDEYEDDYEDEGRFVPGFGDDGDAGYESGLADRGGRRARQDSHGGRGGRRARRRFRWIAPLAALLVIVVPLAVGGLYAYSFYMSKYHPADYSGDGTGSVVVQVTQGENATDLGPQLDKLGVVASSRAFVLAAEHSSSAAGLLPGFYKLHMHMQASLAYALLINPANLVQVMVTIPEGWRVSQIVSWLGAKSGIPASAYRAVLNDPASLGLPSYANGKPEGYLFPATYEVQPHETALGVLKGMVQRFDQEAATANLPGAARQVNLTAGQVIIMASLVQAEGGRLSDYPKIARVIYNRLAHGMPLQLDSTVLYGLDTYGIVASNAQLNSGSPYNTYKHTGLTPGPIDNPGNAAIQAVLHPAPGNWLYFVTVNPKTGETLFTSSEAQFQQYRAELEHNLGQG
ncbi:MAG TPA: endolytic transglycosylase MltG [Streptosporangiaceae bacterium]|nr:endolytic transglycosylase MltG [Streptosporangiaceae bacterium]